MRKTAKRVVSMICVICMLFTTLGTLSYAEVVTADEVKALIDNLILAEVGFDNWSTNEAAVNEASEKEALLADEELVTYQAMTTDDGTLYSAVLDEMELIVSTGSVYDGIMALPEDKYDLTTGTWYEGIDATNYQDYYEVIIDLGIEIDALTTEQQRILGSTILARYSTAAQELEYFWFDYVEQVAASLSNVYESNEAWSSKTDSEKLVDYQTKRAQYEKASQKVAGLYTSDDDNYKPDQLEDVNTELYEEYQITKNADLILEEAKAFIDGIYESKMNEILAVKNEILAMLPITIDNCADINEKAIDGITLYDGLKVAIGANYWDALKDDALEAWLINYRDDSAEYMNAKTFKAIVDGLVADVNAGITKENYTEFNNEYNDAVVKYEALTDDEKALTPTIETKIALDAVGADLADFADAWIAEVEGLIDAIPEFDHATYTVEAEWTAVVEAIVAARAAYNEIQILAAELFTLVTNNADLEAAEAKKAEIEADYAAANAVVLKITALGEVGNLAEDDITLTSRTAIDEAKAAYAQLTDVQKGLVANYADLETADAECAELEAKKAEIEAYIDAFNAAREDVEYTTTEAEIEVAVEAATEAYDDAIAIAEDVAYGTKLASLVDTLKTDKEAFDAFVAAITDLRVKGNELIAAVDAISENVDIRETEELYARLEAYAVDQNAIEEMDQLFAEAAVKHMDYIAAFERCEGLYGEVPVDEEPYETYKKDGEYFQAANEEWEFLNPGEKIEEVEEWVINIENLFDSIDAECEENLVVVTRKYANLVEEYEGVEDEDGIVIGGFDPLAKKYLYTNYLDVLSKYTYIGIRIAQYQAAQNIIETANNVVVPELPVAYDGVAVTLEVYKVAVEAYEDALAAASRAITNAYNTHNNSDTATKEIAGVKDAFEALQAKEAECAIRNAALAFDKKVIVAADSFATLVRVTYSEVIALKSELASFETEVYDAVTSEVLLLEVEVDAVEDLIAAIGTFDIYAIMQDRAAVTDKIDAARDAYDSLADAQKDTVENYQLLIDAEELLANIDTALAFIEAVNALPVIDTTVDWEAVKADAEELRAEYDNFDDVVKGMVSEAYITLQKKQAEIVTYMLVLIPSLEEVRAYSVPEDMEEIKAVLDMLYAIDHIDANGNKAGAYRELTVYSKLRVEGYAKYGVTIEELKAKLAEYNVIKADAVIELIDHLSYAEMTWKNYRNYEFAIANAKEAYAAYVADIAEYQAIINGLTTYTLPNLVSNYGILEDASNDYDRFAAAEAAAADVAELLEKFYEKYPTTDFVTRANYAEVKEEIAEIEAAYEELDPTPKKFVEELVNGLAAYLDKAYVVERYMAVYEAIDELMNGEENIYDAIVNGEAFDVEYGLIISDIEAQYADLTAEEKVEITNYAILETAREAYDKNVSEAIAKTIELIDAIYAVVELDKFALSNNELAEAIDAANDMFNSLSVENQALVTNADELAAANDKIASLVDPADVEAAIDELGDPEDFEITDENYIEVTAAVEAAKEMYESLADDDKLVVYNYEVLVVWIELVTAFEPDQSGDIDLDGTVSVTDITAMVDFVLRRIQFSDDEFERANLVIDDGEQVIDIFDILAAIELIVF